MASIRLENVDMVYPNGQAAARGIDLEVADGEFLVLVGPSGSGKTTLLRIVAGLETPTGGRVLLDDREITKLPPQERDLAMVFQSHALYPHKTVRDNLAFGLQLRRARRETITERVAEVAKILGLTELLECTPDQLSGGERQRVAVGRAIVRKPQAFLFDEPLSNLDPQLRDQARIELARLHQRVGATMLYVTHDQKEAMTLGNRVAVLRDGCLQQIAAPMDLYLRPANSFVAGFIGSPSMNFFPASLSKEAESNRLETPWCNILLNAEQPLITEPSPLTLTAIGEVVVGIRPHDLTLVNSGEADVVARVEGIQPLGNEIQVLLLLPGKASEANLTIVLPPETKVSMGDQVGVRFRRDRLHLFDACSGVRLN
jgi:multiple sugar transport system ATP-binding protein